MSGIRDLIYFVLPPLCLVVLLLAREFAGIARDDRERIKAQMNMCTPFGLGVAFPMIAFLVPYMISGSVHDLLHGLIATPTRAIRFAMAAPASPITMVVIVPFILPVIVAIECDRLGKAICGSILALFASAVLIYSATSPVFYSFGWRSIATAIPGLVLAGVAILWVSRGQGKLSPIRQQQIMLIMCVAALCSVVQFPFAEPAYFFC